MHVQIKLASTVVTSPRSFSHPHHNNPSTSNQAKMLSSSPDFSHKSLQITQDDKFFSRLLSKESSMTATPSFRVYYAGASGAIPFVWESQPGTPKHILSATSLPPLTPPPSYYFNTNNGPIKKNSRSKLLHALFPRFNYRKTHVAASPPSSSPSFSSSSRSSSLSSVLVPTTPLSFRRRRRLSSIGSSFDVDKEAEEVTVGSPSSGFCFGITRDKKAVAKKALLFIVGSGSG